MSENEQSNNICQLPACPFCGGDAARSDKYDEVWCSNAFTGNDRACRNDAILTVKEWCSRPIEAQLRADLADANKRENHLRDLLDTAALNILENHRLQADNARLREALRQAAETVRDADMAQGGSDWITNPPARMYLTDMDTNPLPAHQLYKSWVGKRAYWLELLKGAQGGEE